MKIKHLGSNMAELDLGTNLRIFFSYNTPVVAIDIVTNNAMKTNTKWSRTTSNHIRKYLSSLYVHSITEVDQSVLDDLVK